MVSDDDGESAAATLDRILGLAARVRVAENSPNWKSNTGEANEVHGEACEAMWAELYRVLDIRSSSGQPVKPPTPDDQQKKIKKKLLDELRIELPAAVKKILDRAS